MTKEPTKNGSNEKVTTPVKQLAKEKLPEQAPHTNPTQKVKETVRVLGKVGNANESIVFSTMRGFATKQELDSSDTNQKTLNKFLEEDFFGKEKNAAELNTIAKRKIEAALANGTLKKIDKVSKPDKSTYTHNGATLIQHLDIEGNFTFRPIGKFTGILMVHRSVEGKPNSKQMDIVEYKDGIPIAVTKATIGKSKIANIDLLEKQAAVRFETVANNAPVQSQTSSQTSTGEASS